MTSYYKVIDWVIPQVEYHQNRFARGLGEAIRDGDRWLDIGAGTRPHGGWIGPTNEQLVAQAQFVVGCDMVAEHLAKNKSLIGAAVADAGQLPFAAGAFDLITANMVVEHIEHPDQLIAEIDRVLAPGGRFVFVTPNRTNPIVWLASVLLSRTARKAAANFVETRTEEHIFYTFYKANTPSAIRQLLAGTRLRPSRVERFSSYPFARRPWPLTLVEALWIKLIGRWPLNALSSNLFVELEKSRAEGSPSL